MSKRVHGDDEFIMVNNGGGPFRSALTVTPDTTGKGLTFRAECFDERTYVTLGAKEVAELVEFLSAWVVTMNEEVSK